MKNFDGPQREHDGPPPPDHPQPPHHAPSPHRHHPHHHPPPPHHGGYWAPFPTEEALSRLEDLFADRDCARAAARILYDCPPEIALVVEVLVRVWAARSAAVPVSSETDAG